MFKNRFRRNKDLASLEGRKLPLDQIMTVLSFVILFIVAIIPVMMIIYNALFSNGSLDIATFGRVLFDPENLGAMWNTIKLLSGSP